MPQFSKAADAIKEADRSGSNGGGYPNYTRYYRAQALFQADVDAWKTWNSQLVSELKAQRRPDGGLMAGANGGDGGEYAGTSLSLLALAVNFRFLPIYER
jgi:hypothetical protein